MNFTRVLIIILGCVASFGETQSDAALGPPPPRASFPDQAWKHCRSLPEGAAFAATVAGLDGRIYVIAGSTGESGQLTSRNSAYDPRRDTWFRLAPIPTPRSEPGATLGPAGKIYVVGGNPTRNRKESSRMNVVEVYNPATDEWTKCKPVPTPRTALCAVAAKDASGHVFIYAIGGRNFDLPGNGLDIVEAYDPLTDTWVSKSRMPINLHAMTATLGPEGKIYVLGGTNSKIDNINAVQVYDPAADRWTQPTVMPYGQECACSTFIPDPNGEIVVLGGWGDPKKDALAFVAAYNPRTDSWRWLPQLVTATAAAGAAAIKTADGFTHLYVIGGMPDLACVQEYEYRSAVKKTR